MKKILVTGATGFIGSHLMTRLEELGYEVEGVNSRSGDISEPATWNDYPKTELVVHLAGKSFVPASWSDPLSFIRCNLLGTTCALEYCRKHKASLIYISSYLYGNPDSLPIAETQAAAANNPYALSKKLAEDACRFYADSFDVNVTVLRPFNVYGPRQDQNFLIPSILRQIHEGHSIEVKDLEPRRDYVYIRDLVEAIVRSIKHQQKFSVFNIGSGKSYSVGELITIIQRACGSSLPVVSRNERRKDEVMDSVADITLAGNIIGWQPAFRLEQGIADLVASRDQP
jgi:GDP-4-dehydro-6-deoxy-D-mannose reductase